MFTQLFRIVLLLVCLPALLSAQERALTTFESGSTPIGAPVLGADGNLYGTTSKGGNANLGTVYRLTPGGQITTLASFVGINGNAPTGTLTRGTDGNLYGTTGKGESSNDGTIFRVTPDGTVTTLYIFPSDDKQAPSPLTLGPDGAFYGTLPNGGRAYKGGVFRFQPPGDFRIIASFTDDSYRWPVAPLTLGRDGNLYGTTTYGSVGSKVFRVTPTGTITVLASIDFNTCGLSSASPLVEDASGNWYGVFAGYSNETSAGVFRLSPAGTYTVLTRFDRSYEYVVQPRLVMGADGNLYGTLPSGSGSDARGSVFRLTTSGSLTTLARFSAAQGTNLDGLRPAPDGSFYGVARNGVYEGESAATGSVFRVTLAGEITTLYKFSHSQGYFPSGGLMRAADGNFYGVTNQGGATGAGNIYRVTPGGVRTTLAEFDYVNNGAYGPRGTLCPDVAGTSLHGVTFGGGSSKNYGALFRVGLDNGALSTIYVFSGGADGGMPRAGLVRGMDGAFYGTTDAGGTAGAGTIFRVTAAGELTTLHSFNGTTDGQGVYAGLTLGKDGAFYGSTRGTVFRVTATGDFAVLTKFPFGAAIGPLVLGADDNLYGMTRPAGSDWYGTIFRVTPTGTYTTLLSLGSVPLFAYDGGLVAGPDGHLYGAALGSYGSEGAVFRLTTSGTLTVLRSLPGATQAYGSCIEAPVFGEGGMLYGVSNHAVWRVSIAPAEEAWRQRYFGGTNNVGDAADNADPDGDGMPNLLERAFGSNPLVPDAPYSPTVAPDLKGRLTLSTRRGADALGTTFMAETSTDLRTWSTADVLVLYDGARFFQARYDGMASPRRFMRLRVTKP